LASSSGVPSDEILVLQDSVTEHVRLFILHRTSQEGGLAHYSWWSLFI